MYKAFENVGRGYEIDAVADLFVNKLGIDLNGKVVLDVGCSRGFHAAGMRKLGADAWVNDVRIEKLLEDFTARKIPGKIENAPSEYHGKFDLITAFRVFIDDGTYIDFHKGIAACLKEGGRAIIASDVNEKQHKIALEKVFKNVELLDFKIGKGSTTIEFGNEFFFEVSEPIYKFTSKDFEQNYQPKSIGTHIVDTTKNFLSFNSDSANRWTDITSGSFVIGKNKIKEISDAIEKKSTSPEFNYNENEAYLLAATASELTSSDLNLVTSHGIYKIFSNILKSEKFKELHQNLTSQMELKYINQFFEGDIFKNAMKEIQEFRDKNIEFNYVVNKLLAGEELSRQEHNNFMNLPGGIKVKETADFVCNQVEKIKETMKINIENDARSSLNQMIENVFCGVDNVLREFGFSKLNNLVSKEKF
jgi:SAM-dependent methyltransferase